MKSKFKVKREWIGKEIWCEMIGEKGVREVSRNRERANPIRL